MVVSSEGDLFPLKGHSSLLVCGDTVGGSHLQS